MTLSIPDLDLPQPKDVKNIIFVRIPKTGSSSVMSLKTKKWERASKMHIDYNVWKHWVNKNEKSLSFTIVRNPFAMLRSQYCHRRRKNITGSKATFKEFIETVCVSQDIKSIKKTGLSDNPLCEPSLRKKLGDWNNQILFNQIKTRSLFYQIFDESGECKVDFILKLECIDSCIDFLNTYICNDIKSFPSKNVYFNQEDYKKHYTDEMIRLVESYYHNDLKMFGYNFDGSTGGDAIIDPKTVSIQSFDWDKLFKVVPGRLVRLSTPPRISTRLRCTNKKQSPAPARKPNRSMVHRCTNKKQSSKQSINGSRPKVMRYQSKPKEKKDSLRRRSARASQSKPIVNGTKQSSKKTTRYIMVNGRKMKA